jgi:hypothetical protein
MSRFLSHTLARTLRVAILIAATAPFAVQAATLDKTTAETSNISGHTGVKNVLKADNEYALVKISWAEGGALAGTLSLDSPCYIKATFRKLSDIDKSPTPNNTMSQDLNVCDGGDFDTNTMKSVDVRSPSKDKDILTGDKQSLSKLFSYSVKVCESSNNNKRVKGIQLCGRNLHGDNGYANTRPEGKDFTCKYNKAEGRDEDDRSGSYSIDGIEGELHGVGKVCKDEYVRCETASNPNCKDSGWKNSVGCEKGRLASALVVHTLKEKGKGDNDIIGLGLNCSKVVD